MFVIDEWFFNNNLKINYDKYKFIAFSNDIRTLQKIEITIHNKLKGNTITKICPKLIKHYFVKYLGITIDQNLKLNIYIEYLLFKLSKLTYFFIKAKKKKN